MALYYHANHMAIVLCNFLTNGKILQTNDDVCVFQY